MVGRAFKTVGCSIDNPLLVLIIYETIQSLYSFKWKEHMFKYKKDDKILKSETLESDGETLTLLNVRSKSKHNCI